MTGEGIYLFVASQDQAAILGLGRKQSLLFLLTVFHSGEKDL